MHLIVICGTRYELPPSQVISWIKGYLTRVMLEGGYSAATARELLAMCDPRPGESPEETRYRVLSTCHDRHIIVYQGIRERP